MKKTLYDDCLENGREYLLARWFCEKGHIWESSIQNRSLRENGCPVCAGRVSQKKRPADFYDLQPR